MEHRTSVDLNEWFQTKELLQLIGLLYVLRVPLLLFLILAFMSWGGLSQHGPGAQFLEGIYDVAWPPTAGEHYPDLKIAIRFLLLTLSALMFAVTVASCARNTLRCLERFDFTIGDEDTPAFRGIRVLCTLPPLILAIAIIVCATAESKVSKFPALAGDIVGILLFALFLRAGSRFRHPNPANFLIASAGAFILSFYFLTSNGRICLLILIGIIAAMQFAIFKLQQNPRKWIAGSHIGYTSHGALKGHHLVAAHAFSLALMIYGSFFILKSLNNNKAESEYPVIPTLSVLLILGVLVCWTFSGIAFFFDHYRIPLILPIVVYGSFTSIFPQSDHFFNIFRAKQHVSVSAAGLLDGAAQRPPVVLVSITGGGIRAAAWSARVLRQVQLQSADEDRFLQSVRLVSSVSGGSVGAMYFANAYTNSERKVKRTGAHGDQLAEDDPVLAHAQASSLDDIAVELAYQDTLLGLTPFLRGLDFHRGQWSLLNGRGIYQDRGTALEDAIKRGPSDDSDKGNEIGQATLQSWRNDAKNGVRPAIIMNSSVVETGKRFLLSTTDLPVNNSGRIQFSEKYPADDLLVATAARLSATFPIVSPAARPIHDSVYELSDHAVDGGYTDNYGMASLSEWLNNGLSDLQQSHRPLPKEVLILEIRSSPLATEQPHPNQLGFIFQTLHPLYTLANSRDTGQLSHNDLELDLLKQRWSNDHVNVCPIIFQPKPDGRVEPLNWHLTRDDIGALQNAWDRDLAAKAKSVADYLQGKDSVCH